MPTKEEELKSSKHWVYWKCYECKKTQRTPHTNIPKECKKCGCNYFKWLGNKKKVKNAK